MRLSSTQITFGVSTILIIASTALLIQATHQTSTIEPLQPEKIWEVQSIDTMKFSRDNAREKLEDSSFDAEIATQVKNIAATGATHVAIATPYDDEFLPYLHRWVRTARANGLHVWFRGNLSGWEGWFDYPLIDRTTHTAEIEHFILSNPDLFEDGDIFVSCPECENGGPGDPRENGDVEGHRRFLITEYETVKHAFRKINKTIHANYYSMNGDVAKLVMDKPTTQALDGIIVVDHYVETPEMLVSDIKEYMESSGGKVVLGEWGVPIPDIHGNITDEEQTEWIARALRLMIDQPGIVGHNYWVNRGGSTRLWDDSDNPKPAVAKLTKFFKPSGITVSVVDTHGRKLRDIKANTLIRSYSSVGNTILVSVVSDETVVISKDGYRDVVTKLSTENNADTVEVKMEKLQETIWDRLLDLF